MNKRNWLDFGVILAGAGLLFLPLLPLIDALAKMLPERVDELNAIRRPELGISPFLCLYTGAVVATLLLWRTRLLTNRLARLKVAAIVTAGGGLAYALLLPVLARGWGGFLLWLNPVIWLLALVLAVFATIVGATLTILHASLLTRVPTKSANQNPSS